MNHGKVNNGILTLGAPGTVGDIKLNSDQDNILAIGSGLSDSSVRDSTLHHIATSISPTSNIDTISNSTENIDVHTKCRDSNNNASHNGMPTAAIGSNKHGIVSNLNVNNILTEADHAAIAAQTIALTMGTTVGVSTIANSANNINIMNSNTGTTSVQDAITDAASASAAAASNTALNVSNSNGSQPIAVNGIPEMILGNKSKNNILNNPLNTSNVNLNQSILACVGVSPISLPTNTVASAPTTSFNNSTLNTINAIPPTSIDTNNSNANKNSTINNNQHFQSAILQQNAAIMQQNAATLQHLQNLQQTNKLLAVNPEAAATLGMLAPIMNMNLAPNPVQLLATATPGVASTFLPATTTALQAPVTNFSDFNASITTAPVYPQQHHSIQAPTQVGTIAIAPGGSQTFPAASLTNNINMNNISAVTKNSSEIVDNNNSTDAVQNILRTAFMLQNSGLPLIQQGIISQQQQMIPPSTGGGAMLVPNGSNNTSFGIVPTLTPTNNNNDRSANINSTLSNESNSKKVGNGTIDVGNNGNGPNSGAAAAANAAASVLPPASMNLPLQQQLQQQQFNPTFTPQMGIDLNGGNNINNINLFGGATLNNNNINSGNIVNYNSLQIAGITTLQQQQRIQNMSFPQINLSESNSQVPTSLAEPQQKKQQHVSLGCTLHQSVTQLKQQQLQTEKKQSSISRPLYLDHDSNCLTAYQCFLRKQIELFEVGHDEMTGTAQGRNTPLHYGQVGIRCRHCAHLPKAARARGGVYYSRTIDGVYQVAQNMSKLHFLKACTLIPENTKNRLKSLQSVSSRASGGKEYWADGLRVLGIVEEGSMLRFASNSTSSTPTHISKSTD